MYVAFFFFVFVSLFDSIGIPNNFDKIHNTQILWFHHLSVNNWIKMGETKTCDDRVFKQLIDTRMSD